MIQYTYEPASTVEYPEKPGLNRMTWEDNNSKKESEWTMISKEYFPEDPRLKPSPALAAWLQATPVEKKQLADDLKQYL